MQRREQFRVDGLDCAEEVLLLRRALEGRPGIERLEFDVLDARMVVTFDETLSSSSAIIESVRQVGLSARPWSERMQPLSQTWRDRHGRNLGTGLSGVLLVAGFLTHAVIEGSLTAAIAHGHIGIDHRHTIFDIPLPARLMYLGSILCGLWFVAPRAWGSLRRFQPDMNLLMCIAVAGAVAIGELFEAATVTFLFSLALLLEHWSMERTRRAFSALMNLSPPTARCFSDCGHFHQKPVEAVSVGSRVLVRPHERIPLDGRVLKGTSSVNQAPITGESVPVAKGPGTDVYAGTINEEGLLEIEVTRPAGDTTLARIIHMVQESQLRRAPSEQWVETFARYYTPAMIVLALAIAVVPPLLFAAYWADWIYRGLVVLVIACPCALVISTPVSVVSALTSAARNGVLIKGGRYLEAVARLEAIALDKTGTVTHGRPVVQQIVPLNGHSLREVLERAAALEEHSQHPLARAILRRAEEDGVAVASAGEYRVLSGRGAEGTIAGDRHWIGSQRFMQERGTLTADARQQAVSLEDAGHSVVAVGSTDHICGLIGLADQVREEVPAVVTALRRAGVRRIVLLTGDNEETARAVAAAIGVDEYRAQLLPEDKVHQVEQLRQQYRSVAMVGDGVNDAPAMAVATVGIAMGAMGSDAAIETADIALMSDDLSKLPWLVRHARRTVTTIKQNIGFALGIKVLFVALTLFGAASLWMAIAADTGASLLVIFNGLRLLKS